MKGKIKAMEGIYPITTTDAVYIDGTNEKLSDVLKNTSVKKIQLESIGNNMFNINDCKKGFGWWKTGEGFNDSSLDFTSIIIDIEEFDSVCSSNVIEACFWGNKGIDYNDFISSATLIDISGGKKINVPSNAKYLTLTYRWPEVANEMLNAGEIMLPYENYKGKKQLLTIENAEINPLDGSVSMKKIDNEVAYQLIKNKANLTSVAKTPLFIETYENGNQAIHHKVAYIPDGFNGYKYWMAYTPFPYGQDKYENPCIAVSNNGIKWEVPGGLNNPIDDIGVEINGGTINYWSDTHLLHHNGKLELYYRGMKSNNSICIIRRTSADGINWSDREIILEADGGATVCPVVIHTGEKYLMWLFAKGQMLESQNGINWSKIGDLKFLNTNEKWHFDVIFKDGMYEMVQTGMYGETIEYLKSYDGLKWNKIKDIIIKDKVFYPNVDFYRPSFMLVEDYYNILYTMNDNGYRITGLSIGINKNEPIVYGIDENYKRFMSKPTSRPKYSYEKEFYWDDSSSKLYFTTKIGQSTTWKEVGLI